MEGSLFRQLHLLYNDQHIDWITIKLVSLVITAYKTFEHRIEGLMIAWDYLMHCV